MHLPTVAPSERLFSPQTVCVWNSGVFAARALLGERIPGTYAEVIALAQDSGVPGDLWKKVGQANFTKLAAGMKKRYGLVGTVIEGAALAQAGVLGQAAAGPIVACLAGNQLNLTPHWQQGSIGHAIAVLYEHGTTGLQFDPLAPAGYAGDPFPPAELAKFASAALIFKDEAKEESSMPGFKIGTNIGTFKFVGVHALISPTDTKFGRYLQAANAGPWDVAASLDLKDPRTGAPIDIDGNSPPKDNRDEVWLLDASAFTLAAYALRQDGIFTAAKPTDDELLKARERGIEAAREALANLK